MHQLQGAKQVVISGGNFSQVRYDGGKDQGLNILRQHIAADAMFDSAERFPPAKCHPGTRKRIIDTIMEWINNPAPSESALWLYGPAGAGKSAIAHSIAVLLQEIAAKDKYAASFFFARDAIGRGDGRHLFSTIAYQLALNFPLLRTLIDAAMLDNPTLPTKSIDVQLRYLIIEPLKGVNGWPAHTPTIIIDGLDECSGSKRMQSEILSLISEAIIEHQIPLRFFIVSRPEYWIADSFEVGPLAEVTKPLSLRDDKDADKDIYNYLREGFNKIRGENRRTMAFVSTPWPPEYIIHRFVRSASGQFIYASTVLKFVGSSSDFCDPQEQLRILTSPGPHYASAFSELDRLYSTILSAYPWIDSLKCVLGGIMVGAGEQTIQVLLGAGAAETQLVLSALSSLINVSRQIADNILSKELETTFGSPLCGSVISFAHLSFYEFLDDESRSGRYAIDEKAADVRLVCAILKLGSDLLRDTPQSNAMISSMGVSPFRLMLHRFSIHSKCHPDIFEALKVLNGSLQTVLTSNPSCIRNANHVFWFSAATSFLLPGMTRLFKYKYRKTYYNNRALFDSLLADLNVIMTISAKQMLLQSNMTTTTFAYLASHCRYAGFESHHTPRISKAMQVDERIIICDLHQLRDWIYLDTIPRHIHGVLNLDVYFVTIGQVFRDEVYTLAEGHLPGVLLVVWDNLRLQSSAMFFKQILDNSSTEFLLGMWFANSFLRYSRLADITSKEYFEDEHKKAIFNILLDEKFWHHIDFQYAASNLVIGALSWFKRHMTPEKVALIEEYDYSLPPKMRFVATTIFIHCFLPQFITGRFGPLLVMFDDSDKNIHPMSFHVLYPGCNGQFPIVQERPAANLSSISEYGRRRDNASEFQYHVDSFEKEVMLGAGGSVISHCDWYPHLAASLLTMLVRNQYGTLHEEFEPGWSHTTMTCFVPFLRCLPYAVPSQENLDAIRVLHYLDSKIEPRRRWRPPFGFCSLATVFLKKYDNSLLSSPEFHTLEKWLTTMSKRESKRIITWASEDSISLSQSEDDDYTSDEDD